MQSFPLKFVLVGDLRVGKTQLSKRFVKSDFSKEYVTTVGMEYSTKQLPFQKCNLNAQIWDLAGQERANKMSAHYYKDAVGAILVYDITNRASFENLRAVWMKQLREFGHPNMSLVLVGNKADCIDSDGTGRAVKQQEGVDLAKEFNMLGFVETSAFVAGAGVEGAFRRLIYGVGSMLPPVKVHLDQLGLPVGWILAPSSAATATAKPVGTNTTPPPRVITPNAHSTRSTSPLPTTSASAAAASSPSSSNSGSSSSSAVATAVQTYVNYWTGEVQTALPVDPAKTKLHYTSPPRPSSASGTNSSGGSTAGSTQTSGNKSASANSMPPAGPGGSSPMEVGGRKTNDSGSGVPVKNTKACCIVS